MDLIVKTIYLLNGSDPDSVIYDNDIWDIVWTAADQVLVTDRSVYDARHEITKYLLKSLAEEI